VKYFHIFGSKCFKLHERENLGKFDTKSDVGIFLGYCHSSRAYRVYNSRTDTIMESINVVIRDESSNVRSQQLESKEKLKEVEEPTMEESKRIVEFASPKSNVEPTSHKVFSKDTPSRLILNYPKKNILGSITERKKALEQGLKSSFSLVLPISFLTKKG
jgi:hypothetical protein